MSVLVETLKWHYTVSYLWSVFIASSVAGVQPNWMARSLMVMFVERSNILSKAFKPLAYTFLFTPDNFKPSSWIKLIESFHGCFFLPIGIFSRDFRLYGVLMAPLRPLHIWLLGWKCKSVKLQRWKCEGIRIEIKSHNIRQTGRLRALLVLLQ